MFIILVQSFTDTLYRVLYKTEEHICLLSLTRHQTKQLSSGEIKGYKETEQLLLIPQLFTVNICHLTDVAFYSFFDTANAFGLSLRCNT